MHVPTYGLYVQINKHVVYIQQNMTFTNLLSFFQNKCQEQTTLECSTTFIKPIDKLR